MKWLVAIALVAACDLDRMQDQPKCQLDGTLGGEPCNMEAPEGIVAWNDTPEPPPPLTRELVLRGRDRYDHFCAACHGLDGDGHTEVTRYATRPIPSLLSPAVVALPDDRILQAIATGFGSMPRQPLAHVDRWAVMHYVRVLQRRDDLEGAR